MKAPRVALREPGRRFQGYLEEVLRVMDLPATWASDEPATVVSTLLEGALGMLRLEFSCLRLHSPFDGIPAETSRVYANAQPALEQQLSHAVDGWLSVTSEGCRVVANPVGPGRVTIACLRLGIREARGILVVGARRASFPTRAESVLLRVAVNQVVIGLDEVRRSVELENGRDVTERRVADAEPSALKEMVAQSGFDSSFPKHVHGADEASAFGRAIVHGGRIISEDVMAAGGFAADRAMAEAAAFRAMQSTPLLSSAGQPLGVLSIHFRRPHRPSERDLRLADLYARLAAQGVEREQTRAALRRSEFFLAEAQRISHTGSWVWNMITREVRWSDEHCRIFGFAPGRVEPTHDLFWATLHSEDRAFTRQQIDEAVTQRRGFDEPFRLARQDGSVRHVRGVGHPVFDDAGDVVEYVGTIADVTPRKLAEEVARRAEHDLARVDRAMTMAQFTATIAHEMSQSLAGVVLNADAGVRWLAANPPNLAEVEACVRRIASDAHRASDMLASIRSLLTGSTPQRTTLSIGDILPDVVSLIQGKARAGKVQVSVSAPKQLPRFSGDRIQLQQVLINLALNAIEAMRSVSGRPRRLDISVAQNGDTELRFEVRDSGPGLDSTRRDRVFDAYFTTKDRGMGMGLAICRSIIQAHGGRLWVHPNAGPGETFQFTLPLSGSLSGAGA